MDYRTEKEGWGGPNEVTATTASATAMGTFQKFCLRWNNHSTNLLGTLGHVLTSEQHTDVTLCCQGEVWKLHKLVLCAASSHFEKILGALPPGSNPIVVLDGPHPQDVALLIHFIYHGEVNVHQENLASLLRTAESLKIKGLSEVSSVTSSSTIEHKNISDGDSQRHTNRGRSRPSSRQSTPICTVGTEYPVGMYGLVTQTISPQTQIVPDQVERDPSPLNLSFSGTLKNIHDETPQERQERRNRLDNLLYAATERSKKEERREARREAREAALREAAAMRESSVMIPQDTTVISPAAKRPRVSECSRNSTLPAHPAFHIPIMNLSVPPGGATTLTPSHSSTPTPPKPNMYESPIHMDHVHHPHLHHPSVPPLEPIHNQHGEMEIITKSIPVKVENMEISSDMSVIEDIAVNSDESDTKSAPETPSDLSLKGTISTTTTLCIKTPVPPVSTITAATQVSLSSSGAMDDVSSSSASSTPATTATLTSATNTSSAASPLSESSEEKPTPYYHSILRQVAEVNTNGEPVSTNSQRVTINMRTFKEEWRRQLLVDYDTRTNMSICMLCFTTFKSYDGPRKNTYVKHAKRFHPALEDYSDKERDIIIDMYEKYHKYDVDRQKEVHKNYRTNNAIAALNKKGVKHNEAVLELAASANSAIQPKTESAIEIKRDTSETETQADEKPSEELVKIEKNYPTPSSDKGQPCTSESESAVEENEESVERSELQQESREKVNNNNLSLNPQTKRSQMNTRAKAAASAVATTVSV